MVVTPELSPELGVTLGALRSSGIECAVVWTGAVRANERLSGEESMAGEESMTGEADMAREMDMSGAMPTGVPVYPVASEEDLGLLGGDRL